MSAHEVAQSDRHSFSGMMAPDLPVGSPERAALFRELRRTFAEDWKEAERAVARIQEIARGHLYFIRCADCVKIGRTIDIVRRLANMQSNTPHDLDCLLLLRGQGGQEKAWHERFAADRIRGEWFRLTPELEAAICAEREALEDRAGPTSVGSE